jgi:DegV family protein with EDD domain
MIPENLLWFFNMGLTALNGGQKEYEIFIDKSIIYLFLYLPNQSRMKLRSGAGISELTGKQFYYSFLAGANKLFEHQQEINKINVFPVKDGDTGTNLASTFQSIVDSPIPTNSVKRTITAMADAALAGARGNSGIIFAQFIIGLSNELPHCKTLTVPVFAEAAQKASGYTYQAVSKPVEGTMITVIREWAEFLYSVKDKKDDFIKLITESYDRAKISLAETTEKLEVLKKNHVVDAGAKGFVVFLEGMIEFFVCGKLKELIHKRNIEQVAEFKPSRHKQFNYRFCTEAMMEPRDVTRSFVQQILNDFGDSVVVAGSDLKLRFHVHTDDPAKLFDTLTGYGHVFNLKVDDMVLQEQVSLKRKSTIAIVTDSSIDLPKSFIEERHVHIIPMNLHFGRNHYLDRVTITSDQFYSKLAASEEQPTTSQPGKKEFLNKFNYLTTYYNSVICICISSQVSGTYQNAFNAAREIQESSGKRISVIDSRTLSACTGLLVLRIFEELKHKPGHEELVSKIYGWIPEVRPYAAVKTMKYLIRGGRLSPMKGFIANLLKLKPVISFSPEGRAITLNKMFTQGACLRKIFSIIKNKMNDHRIWNYAVVYSDPGEYDATMEMAEKLTLLTGKPPVFVESISPVVGVNTGPGTIGVMVMWEK